MSARPTSRSSEGKDQDYIFFSQTMDRYKRSVEQSMENNDAVRASHDLASNYISEGRASKNAKIADSDTSTDGGGASLEGHSEQIDGTTELAKKRLASRVSSRRTREREKLRMDHFRNAKVKLLEENKKISDENQKIRSIILKIRTEKALRDQSAAGVLSMFGSKSQSPAPAPMFAPAAVAPPRQQAQTDLSALLLNALTQNLNQQQAPLVPTQDQQLMALVGLVSNQPGLAQLVGQMHQTQQQQQTGLSQLVGQIHHALPGLSQLVGQMHQNQQQQPPGLSQLVGQLHQAQQQQQPQSMNNLVAALQGNSNFGVAPNPNQSLQHNLLSILLGQGANATTSL
jgi:hypothetical protein